MNNSLSWHVEQRKVSELKVWAKNPHTMTEKQRKDLSASIDKFDYVEIVVINTDNTIVGGHQRITDFIAKGKQDVFIDVRVPNRKLTDKELDELALRLNKNKGYDDEELLRNFFNAEDLKEWGFDEDELNSIFNIEPEVIFQPESLQEKFIIPPFSIFDTRQGYWQDRKSQWNSLGFDSQETREDVELVAKSGQSPAIYELRNEMRNKLKREPEWDEIIEEAKKRKLHIYEGASIFDPVLAEICYKWFCPDGGNILDPFAGGSVRGIVASIIGMLYTGIDLRPDQVEVNWKQAKEICPVDSLPNWIIGDSNKILETELILPLYDFVFSCPPYHDLEQYSDDPADLSNMTYEDFIKIYRSIIKKSVDRLKENRFACFVVGDIRDEKGFYRNFVSDTISAFQDAGALLYNEIILINVAGSLPIRVGRQFEAGRKVGKMHQNVLVFYKGDPKKIKESFPALQIQKLLQEQNL